MPVSNKTPSNEKPSNDSSPDRSKPVLRSWQRPVAGDESSPTTVATNNIASAILRWPVVWGGVTFLGLYSLIWGGVIQGPFVERYFDSHPVEYMAIAMFFVAVATLIIKAFDVAVQKSMIQSDLIEPRPAEGQPVADCDRLLNQMVEGPATSQESYLFGRLRESLLFVKRKGSAESLDDQLRYLSEVDEGRSHSDYGLVRTIIWAIPILGFLGTVIGITLALAALDPNDSDGSIMAMTGGLNTAFDTTALALGLSIPLVFATFYVVRYESRLLEAVDRRVEAELVGRFEQTGTETDPQAASVRRMGEVVVRATESLVQRQSEIWQETIDAAHQQWSQLSTDSAEQTEATLTAALEKSLKEHAGALALSERGIMDQNRRHWDGIQQALTKATDTLAHQQAELGRQGEIMLKVVAATGEVQGLEEQLNRNLAALSGAKNFETTVTSLAAAIQLLSAKLELPVDGSLEVNLSSEKAA